MAIALVSLLGLGVCASVSAEPLSMTFTEDRANVGVQLSDAAMFTAPDTAPLTAQIDPVSGSITAGDLQVPQFSTHITEPINADVTVDFEIGTISGSFNQASGALTLEGEANATLTSEGKECSVTTAPDPLVLSTAGNSGGANPRSGAPFSHGLSGAGALAGQWSDMHATAVGGDTSFCENVEGRIEGPGGIWLAQKGDVTPPVAPQLTGTDPGSPSTSATPRVLGSAEAGSTVRIYRNDTCSGLPVATGSAAELAAPGIAVTLDSFSIDPFSATATDVAGNTSPCSTPISYTHDKILAERCIVPKLIGRTLGRAKAVLKAAGCRLGTVRKPERRKGKRPGGLIVKSSSPVAGAMPADGKVNLRLGPKPQKARR